MLERISNFKIEEIKKSEMFKKMSSKIRKFDGKNISVKHLNNFCLKY